jgi:hypothetical protein
MSAPLVDPAIDPRAMKKQRERETANATSDDDDVSSRLRA